MDIDRSSGFDNRPVCLVVDDVRACRLQLSRWLLELGYCCVEADSGQVAMNLIVAVKPDLVVTDIDMPEISGLELLQMVRASDIEAVKRIPVVVISSLEDDEVPTAVRCYAANAFLAKPLEKQCFINAVQSMDRLHPVVSSIQDSQRATSSRLSFRFRAILERVFARQACSLR